MKTSSTLIGANTYTADSTSEQNKNNKIQNHNQIVLKSSKTDAKSVSKVEVNAKPCHEKGPGSMSVHSLISPPVSIVGDFQERHGTNVLIKPLTVLHTMNSKLTHTSTGIGQTVQQESRTWSNQCKSVSKIKQTLLKTGLGQQTSGIASPLNVSCPSKTYCNSPSSVHSELKRPGKNAAVVDNVKIVRLENNSNLTTRTGVKSEGKNSESVNHSESKKSSCKASNISSDMKAGQTPRLVNSATLATSNGFGKNADQNTSLPGLKRPCKDLNGASDSTTFKTPRLRDCTNVMRTNSDRNDGSKVGNLSKLTTPSKGSNVSSFKTPRLIDRTNILRSSIDGNNSNGSAMKIAYERSNAAWDETPFKTPRLPKSLHRNTTNHSPYTFTVTPLKNGTPLVRYNAGGVTPPLCDCGRRSRRLTVSKIGPNQGRVFYTCPVKKARSSFGKSPVSVNKSKNGCTFFCWEPSAM